MPADSYQRTLDRMEPDLHHLDTSAALPSIAISLRRQADALERIADALTLPGPDRSRLNFAEVVESIQQYGVGQG